MRAIPTTWMIAGGAIAAALVYVAVKGAKGTGAGIGAGVVDFADGVLSGGVIAVGERVGVPQTNLTECERAKAEGRTWDASFACPAGTFIRYLWS